VSHGGGGIRAAAALAALLLAGCAARDPGPPATFDALFPEGRRTVPIAELVARVELAPGEELRIEDLGRDERTSHHLVALRGAETPHRHDRHDLVVVLLRGWGRMRIGRELRDVGQGSTLYVPRGTVHAFANAAPEPAVAYVVYAPPYDGVDRVPSE
jgi:mannose-6-phosphate isomerase-like protein (cupin superfamily)